MPQQTIQDRLARDLIPLVHDIAGQIARRVPAHVTLDDLVGAGMLGLANALTRFDANRAETFKGYAEFRIRGAIMDDLRQRDIMSRDARIASKQLARKIDRLNNELGHPASDEETAEYLGVSLEEFHDMQLRLSAAKVVSVENIELSDTHTDPIDVIAARQLRSQLADAINRLPEKQRLVLWLYYHDELPLREIADMMGVTPSRVCQIRTEAVDKLRFQVRVRRLAA
jgi:RNA polymerase sigma factor for flagellar operon FliA